MKPIYVFGHRHPDNDSICSAVAYAHLKNIVDSENTYIPARLGDVPRETQWVFERWGATLPEYISHIHTRVGDVMSSEVVTITANQPMIDAGDIMRGHGPRALPVVDDEGRVIGLLSQHSLATQYLEETEIVGFAERSVTVSLLARAVSGEIIAGDAEQIIAGRVHIAADEPETVASVITPGDAVIVGNRIRTQPIAIEAGAGVLIVTMGKMPAREVLDLAREKGTVIILTEFGSYEVARKVSLAQSVGDIMDTELTLTTSESLLSEASSDLFSSAQRELVVVDGDRRCVGILTRTDVARGGKRRVVLVDHNEHLQSAVGIEDAAVVEIVDHHRVGDIQSAGPILFLNMPVGSTATIVALRFFEQNVDMPREIAGILISALLTDTVVLKSPTTTKVDHEIVAKLAAMLDIDYRAYGMELFKSKSNGAKFSAKDALNADIKEYRVGDLVIAIGQYETIDISEVLDNREAVKKEMGDLLEAKGYDIVVLMATDIIREGSEMFVAGKERRAERALGITLKDGSAWMDGILSRKKQVASRFMDAS
ncbi:MAG: putative manganese-dependent inorganic diphosphatase [Coriobacteriia bacterium]|nr:putative manganese-dependent inorganic diphosphatase [Coriobacteriia bacterium]